MFPLLANNHFCDTSLYSITIFHLSTYSNLGTFLVCLPIVLSLMKAPIGLVYKPTCVSLFPLASSTLYLLSNLISLPWNYWLDLSLTDFFSLPTHVQETRNSTCPCTTLECMLLEIRLHSPHNIYYLLCAFHTPTIPQRSR